MLVDEETGNWSHDGGMGGVSGLIATILMVNKNAVERVLFDFYIPIRNFS